jgi:DNA-binding transcriptional regulator GbsR (MarR family)
MPTTLPEFAPPEGDAPAEPAIILRAQDELADVCASIAEFWGFTRTQGRIFGLLLMSPEPLEHGAIQRRLEISAGSTSMTLATLLDWGVLHRDGRKYRAETDFWKLITHVLERRERARVEDALERVASVLAELRAAAPSDPRVAFLRDRLAYIHDFFLLGRSLLNALLSRGPVRGILGSLARRAARAAAPR